MGMWLTPQHSNRGRKSFSSRGGHAGLTSCPRPGWACPFPTGCGKEYLVKAGQVLAFEVLHYLVTKPPFPGLSEEAHTPPSKQTPPWEAGSAGGQTPRCHSGSKGFRQGEKALLWTLLWTFRNYDIPCVLSGGRDPEGDKTAFLHSSAEDTKIQ